MCSSAASRAMWMSRSESPQFCATRRGKRRAPDARCSGPGRPGPLRLGAGDLGKLAGTYGTTRIVLDDGRSVLRPRRALALPADPADTRPFRVERLRRALELMRDAAGRPTARASRPTAPGRPARERSRSRSCATANTRCPSVAEAPHPPDYRPTAHVLVGSGLGPPGPRGRCPLLLGFLEPGTAARHMGGD